MVSSCCCFDVLGRKFVIFGLVFWPQDIHLILMAFITSLVFIVLVYRGVWQDFLRMDLSANHFHGICFPPDRILD